MGRFFYLFFLINLFFISDLRGTTNQDVSLVRVAFLPLLGDEQQLVEQEERPLVLGPLQAERPLQDQLAVANEIGALPVGQKALDFLQEAWNRRDLNMLAKTKGKPIKRNINSFQ